MKQNSKVLDGVNWTQDTEQVLSYRKSFKHDAKTCAKGPLFCFFRARDLSVT